jgi:hypothetical protein
MNLTRYDPTPNDTGRHAVVLEQRRSPRHGLALVPDLAAGPAPADREASDGGSIHAWESEGGAIAKPRIAAVSGITRRMAIR